MGGMGTPPARPRLCLMGGGRGGGGSGTQKLAYQTSPEKIFPIVNFIFLDDGHFGLGGQGRGDPPPCGTKKLSTGLPLPRPPQWCRVVKRSPAPLCDIPSGCCSFTGPWTLTRSSLRMLRRVAAFCRPLRPVLPLVSFPRSRSPVVGVPGLCWMWRDVPFACQRRPIIGVLRMCWLLPGSFDCFCCPAPPPSFRGATPQSRRDTHTPSPGHRAGGAAPSRSSGRRSPRCRAPPAPRPTAGWGTSPSHPTRTPPPRPAGPRCRR